MVSENDMARQMMAYKAKVEGYSSIAQSYVDLIEGVKHEQNKQKQSDQADGNVL